MIAGHDADWWCGWGGALTDWVSLGVLASSVPRDAVDDAVAATGKGARRAGGKLPPHVMVYFVMALALFADEDYEEVAARLTEALRGWGCWDADVGGADAGRDHPGPAAARARAGGGGVLAGRGAGRGPGHDRGVPGAVAADVGGRDGVGCPGHGANRAAFGSSGTGGDDQAAFPKIRVVTVSECGSHAPVLAAMGRGGREGQRGAVPGPDAVPAAGGGLAADRRPELLQLEGLVHRRGYRGGAAVAGQVRPAGCRCWSCCPTAPTGRCWSTRRSAGRSGRR